MDNFIYLTNHNAMNKIACFIGGIVILLCSCKDELKQGSPQHILKVTSEINSDALAHQEQHAGDWLTYGLNYAENRYSPLEKINKDNINTLGLKWTLDLGTKRGLEATPLVVDGIMYVTGDWSRVFAIDVRKGSIIWQYDPQVPRKYGEKACCDVVNRGVALYKGKVYAGTFDGRLIALDATTGQPVWSILTVDTTRPYSITGAPRVIEGKIIIGNGGAEYGVRGYFSAFDAETGKQLWRCYTVPGDPSKPFESKAMEAAAKTWNGEWWKYGGGGTVWDAMAYDPELKLLYIGTGNGSPWDRTYRSPAGGDNLYLSSILAVNPDNGEIVWHYQTTPGDSWDFTATQHIILVNLDIKGQKRKVLMQAPKNGFFYVIDRTNGKFISGDPFVYTSWAKSIDTITGRPIETDFAHYQNTNTDISPTYDGAHNWHPMAYNPKTNLVYIPAAERVAPYGHDPHWEYGKAGFGSGNGWNLGTGTDPSKPFRKDTIAARLAAKGMLIAWDPIARKEKWRVSQLADWNGGVLTTASNLVMQGTAEGSFVVYDASYGTKLWETFVGGGVIAPPVTYLVDGKQYITLVVGWGSGVGQKRKWAPLQPGRVFTFSLDAHGTYPEFIKKGLQSIPDIPFTATQDEITRGQKLFNQYCAICHVINGGGGGIIPDLVYTTEATHKSFMFIVQKGAYLANGMPMFGDRLSEQEIMDVEKFILNTAKNLKERNQ